MNNKSKKTHINQPSNSLAYCKHEQVLSYELSDVDQADFCQRLDLVLKQSNNSIDSEFSLNFLTPSLRGQRAKSMLATTRASKHACQSTVVSNIDEWSPENDENTQRDNQSPSVQKQNRSNTRRPQNSKNRLPAPSIFRNCQFCGAFFINDDIVAVKPRQYCFRTEILPSQLICAFFQMQNLITPITRRDDVDQMCGQDIFLNGRKRIIDGVYKMGVKFRQARETIHIAIEMIDQYYLATSQEMSAKSFKVKLMHPAAVILHQVTVLLIASKFDEIDDNITAIQDLREYVQKQVSNQQRRDFSLLPSFEQIVECERKLVVFFNWDLKFVLPLHIVRAYLANGVLFSNEFADLVQQKTQSEVQRLKADWSRSITTESLSISDLIVSKGNVTFRSESSSDIAASIIYLARKNILEADSPTGKPRVPHIWPQELVMITRCTESKAKQILVDVLRPLEPTLNNQEQVQQEQLQNKQLQASGNQSQKNVLTAGFQTQRQLEIEAKTTILGNKTERVSKGKNNVANSAQSVLEKYAKKDNRFMMKLSVLSQQQPARATQPTNNTSSGEAMRTVGSGEQQKENGRSLVTDRSSLFSINYQSQPTTATKYLDCQQKADTAFKQNNVKSSVELFDKGIGKGNGEPDTKAGSFIQILNPNNGIKQAQSQRHLFTSTTIPMNNYQQLTSQESQKPCPIFVQQVQDHLLDDPNTLITQQSEPARLTSLTDDDDETVEHAYFGKEIQRRSTQPNKQTLPQIQGATAIRQGSLQTCEKPKELSSTVLSPATAVETNQYYQNPQPSIASQSIVPTLVSVTDPFSTGRRPKNELGFQDETNVSKPTEDQAQTPFVVLEEKPGQESEDERDDSMKIPIARSSDLLPKPKPQPKINMVAKKQQIAKQNYIDIKRAQIAKKQQRTKISNSEADVQSPTDSNQQKQQAHQTIQNQVSAQNTRNGQSKKAPYTKTSNTHLQKKDSKLSQESNEYFSVRPNPNKTKIDVQLAVQSDIIRSSSIEYDTQVTHTLDHSSMLPTEYTKQQGRRWTVRNSNPQSKMHVPPVSILQPASQQSETINSTQNKLAASQVSFFKRDQQRSIVMQNSGLKGQSANGTSIAQINDPMLEILNSDPNLENSLGSREGINAYESLNLRDRPQSKTTTHKLNTQILPSIDRKPQTATNQLSGQNALNFDFSAATDRHICPKPITAKNQVKYMTKTSGLQAMQRNKGKEQATTATQGLLRQQHAQSMRHMLPSQNYDTEQSHLQILSQQSGISKTKSSIFGGQNNSSTATKSMNGFGATAAAVQHETQQRSSKGFLRKGPSFNQMNYIATPTNQFEPSGSAQIITEQAKERRMTTQQSSVNYSQMANFKQNLISANQLHHTQQQALNSHHRTGSTSKTHQHANKHSQMLQNASQQQRFNQHSHTLKQVAADEALASLNKHQHAAFNQNPEMAGGQSSRTFSKNAKDLAPKMATSNGHYSNNHSSETLSQQYQYNLRHSSSKGGHQSKTATQKLESSSSRLRQVPSNMMPTSQPIYGNKRNHGTHLNGQKTQAKLLTVEQNKPSSFLTGQQAHSTQQLSSQYTGKQLPSGRSYENVKMLNRQPRNGNMVAADSQTQSILQHSSINSAGYQNLRMRTLKQSNQQQDSKH